MTAQVNNEPIYIAGASAISPIGDSLEMTLSSVECGICAFMETSFNNRYFKPIRGAMVPPEALQPLPDEENVLSAREGRLLQLALSAVAPLMSALKSYENIPLLLAGPECLPSFKHFGSIVGSGFFRSFHKYSGISVDRDNCRYISSGRSGGLELLAYAQEYFSKGVGDVLLLGAVDSFYDRALLSLLDVEERVMAVDSAVGFFPGESAIFLLLTSSKDKSKYRASINGPGIAREEGHLYSDRPCLGDGLTLVCESLLANNTRKPLSSLWSTVNGEPFSIKEVGIALIRYSKYFLQNYTHLHPAEYFGDCGAASGLLMMALAVQKAENENGSGASLVLASSDTQNRAGVVVEW